MDKKGIVTAFLLAAGLLGTPNVQAQRTYEEMEQLTVNEQVTTVITASEPVRFVDISTDKVVGDQPIDNIVRLKPKEGGHEDGEVLAIVTIVTERYRTQYALLYTTRVREAVTDEGNPVAGTKRLPQPGGLDVHRGDDTLRPAYLELAREDPQRRHQGTPHDHAVEQHLHRGRVFLHRLLNREPDEHTFRHDEIRGEAGGQEN